MKWYPKHTTVDPAEGSVRVSNRFAWAPVYIAGIMVWLATYEILQVYRITEEKVILDNKEIIFLPGRWIDITKRCK